MILAIDPGTRESAYVLLRKDGTPEVFGKVENLDLLDFMPSHRKAHCVIEMLASFGMPVGAEVFETVYWIGSLRGTLWGTQGN